ncbi:MAG: DinB family protein [Ramlibacter sp.]|nr:DinB family protein [Ramlibacter sp.]
MDSAFIDNYRFLARYNRWFNQRLYAACDPMGDEGRRLDRGAFFGSIHGTLNHLVWADSMWLQRFARQGVAFAALAGDLLLLPAGASFATELEADWDALRARRERLDAAVEDWLADMPPGFLQQTMRYANSKGVWREHPAWQALTHFFNHQTHHRGQATTLLTQAGVDVGTTDLIALV